VRAENSSGPVTCGFARAAARRDGSPGLRDPPGWSRRSRARFVARGSDGRILGRIVP